MILITCLTMPFLRTTGTAGGALIFTTYGMDFLCYTERKHINCMKAVVMERNVHYI